MNVTVKDKYAQLLSVFFKVFMGILIFRQRIMADLVKGRFVVNNKDMIPAIGLGGLKLIRQIGHLLFKFWIVT